MGRDPKRSSQTGDIEVKIGVICLSWSWGGLEQVAASDTLELAALGLGPCLIVLTGSPIDQHFSGIEGVEVLRLDYRPRDFMDRRLIKDLRGWIDGKPGITLLHLHQPTLLGTVVPALWKRSSVALVVTRHILNAHNKRDPYHYLLYSRVDLMLVISQMVRRNVILTHPLAPSRVRVVNLGLDFEQFNPETVDPAQQRAQWGADADTVVIGLVGRIDPAKGQATFIRAAAGLMKTRRPGERIKFVIVGEETLGSTMNHVQDLGQMVHAYRLEQDIVFAGYQKNIPEVMRAFDIFVMPSRQEAFGLVAIEAMAMECPIVISRGGSAEEIVGDQEYGLTIRAESAFDLQAKLRYLMDHPMERVAMGRKAREHVRANYDRHQRLKNTLEAYREVLIARGQSPQNLSTLD